MPYSSKNINALVDAALAVELEEAKEAGALGFMARALVQATIPHRDPGDVRVWGRENGAFSMVMQPGVLLKGGEEINIGLPYGSIPRLVFAWMTKEAVVTKSPTLVLGHTLSRYMDQLGLVPTGGRWGSITRLREQMTRLFSARVACYYGYGESGLGAGGNGGISGISKIGFDIAKTYQLWWDPKIPEQAAIWESEVTLSRDFFDEITNCPVPIDIRVLKALKQSPMALDIYCWLTYRMSYLKHITEIPWEALQMQFGASYAKNPHGVRNFKQALLRELKKVLVFYKEANVEEGRVGLVLKPSKTHIPFSVDDELPKIDYKNKGASALISDNEKLRIFYSRYRKERLVEVIEKELDFESKKSLLSEFRDYLLRNKATNVSGYDIQDTKTQEWLYRFVDNNWHSLLEQIMSFDEFLSSNNHVS